MLAHVVKLRPASTTLVALLSGLMSSPVSAHSFGQTYTLPVPIWMYLYGAAAALALSFLMVGYFVRADSFELNQREGRFFNVSRWLATTLRCLSVAALALTIVAGLVGTNNAYLNINMTLFWVIFYLGFTYCSALLGNWFVILNPFKVLVEAIERLAPGPFSGRYAYPAVLAYWPALFLYIAFIWIELLGHTTPFSLSVALSVYSAINLLGCWMVGKVAWFERCEFLGVFLDLISRISPLRVEACDGRGTIAFRQPFSGLLQQGTVGFSLLLFILFMLSSTAFDGMKETAVWVAAFWKNLYQMVLIPIYGNTSPVDYPTVRQLFRIYQGSALLLSPLLYFVIYALFLFTAKALARTTISLKTMLRSFAYCLIPIAFAYHASHYYTLLQVQGAQMLRLVSDPLGIGWNLFGTAHLGATVIPNLAVVWHAQVFLIIAGHVVSVYLAHLQALKLFPDRRSAILSQLPVLILMVAFTSLGLWILSLPLGSGPVRLD